MRLLPTLLVLAACGSGPDDPVKCKQSSWFIDADGDGFGDPQSEDAGCDQPDEGVHDNTDCDDSDPDAHPGGAEVYYDGIDQACDGLDDEWDQDGDGYTVGGGPSPTALLDCDDTDPDIHPDVVINGDDQLATANTPALANAPWIASQGAELRLGPVQNVDQHHATVALGDDGTFLLAWQAGSLDQAEAYTQHFDLDGTALANPVRLNDVDDTGGKPDVEFDGTGYWVTWQDNQGSVYLKRFGRDGSPQGASIAVYESSFEAEGPDLALLPDGTVRVVWNVDSIPNETGRDYYRSYDIDGTPLTDVLVAAVTGRSVADAVGLPDGHFVVVGTNKDSPPDGQVAEVYGRIIGPDRCVTQFRADQGVSDFPSRPAVAAGPDGTFAVTWRNKIDSENADGVYTRFFQPDGRAITDQIALSPLPNDGNRAVVAFAGSDAFFSWQSTRIGPGNDVASVAIDAATGDFSVAEYSQNADETANHDRPAIATGLEAGDPILVTVWEASVVPDKIILGRVTRFSR